MARCFAGPWMDKFRLEIELGNDTMRTPSDVARALRETATRVVRDGTVSGAIRDINGNTVGHFEFRRVLEE